MIAYTSVGTNDLEKALDLGGSCEGEPGPRADDMYYMAYVRDLDGNKIALFAPNA